jgi:hypothetical protein
LSKLLDLDTDLVQLQFRGRAVHTRLRGSALAGKGGLQR